MIDWNYVGYLLMCDHSLLGYSTIGYLSDGLSTNELFPDGPFTTHRRGVGLIHELTIWNWHICRSANLQ